MGNNLLKKLADELKEARENKKITIDQIFTKTRIDKKYLNAIEEGNFSLMPDVYIRAFLKEYSNAIGLTASEVLSKYELAQKGIDFDEPEEIEGKPLKQHSDTKEHTHAPLPTNSKRKTEFSYSLTKSNKNVYYVLTGVLILFSIFIIYKVFLSDQNTEIITEKPFDEIVQSQNNNAIQSEIKDNDEKESVEPDKIEPKKIELASSVESPKDKVEKANIDQSQVGVSSNLVLTVLGSDKSWIRVVTDEKDNMEFIIDKGISKVLNANDKFYLHIGNSGGIKLFLNNKELNFIGAPGKVRKIFITKNGIEYLRRTPIINDEKESD